MARPEIRVRGSFWLVLALWMLLIPLQWMMGAVIAATVHELGHMAAIWATGGTAWSVEVGPCGARIETGPMAPETELLCALAGPVAGGLVCLFWRWLPEAAVMAFFQTAFNLLPVFPLDGGRAWRAVRNICCK